MGAVSINQSTAKDNRLAVTDNGWGASFTGDGSNTTLAGHIVNLNGANGGGKAGGGSGGGINVNLLDNNAINRAFDFAGGSLSAVLDSVISGQKLQSQTAQNVATAQIEAEKELQKNTIGFIQENGKKIIVGGVIVIAGWWFFFKGKK